MKVMVAMATFSTVLMPGVWHSSAKCRRNFTLGLVSPKFSRNRRNVANEDDNNSTRD